MKKQQKSITDAAEILRAAGIEPADIQGEFARIPGLIATYNEAYAEALSNHLTRKAQKERIFAQVYLKHRADALEIGEKVSEGVLKARVLISKEYILAMERAAAAEVEKVRLSGVLDALTTKRDALISLGAHLRTEMHGAPLVRSRDRSRIDEEDFDVEFGGDDD